MLVGLGRVDLIKNKIYFRILFFVAIMLTATSIIALPERRHGNVAPTSS